MLTILVCCLFIPCCKILNDYVSRIRIENIPTGIIFSLISYLTIFVFCSGMDYLDPNWVKLNLATVLSFGILSIFLLPLILLLGVVNLLCKFS